MQWCFASAAPPSVLRALGRTKTEEIEHLPSVEGRKIAPPAWHGRNKASPEMVSRNWSSDRPPSPKSKLCRHDPFGIWGEVVQLFFHSARGWVGPCHSARAIEAQDLNVELGERGRHPTTTANTKMQQKGNDHKWCNFSSIDGTLPTCNCQTKSLRGRKLTHDSNLDKTTTHTRNKQPFKL